VNQELLLRNEYLVTENRILREKLPSRLRLSNPERSTLAEIGKRLGRKALREVACVAKPDTILAWYRRLVAQKFDGSKHRQYPALRSHQKSKTWWSGWRERTPAGDMTESLAHWPTWAITCPIKRWGTYSVAMGIAPAPKRSQITTWKDFLAAHMNVLAGCDFFTVEVLTWRGLVTYYVLFFLHLESRRVTVGGITRHPDQEWMEQIGRSATQETWGYLHSCRYVLHDRDTKFCASFRAALASGGVKTVALPAHSPNLNAFAERWVRSVKQECLSKVILFGERPLSRVLAEYTRHYHSERNHQGKGNRLLFPVTSNRQPRQRHAIACRQRLGGLLKYYERAA